MPNDELVQAIYVLQYVQISSGLNHYLLSYRVHRHTHTLTEGHTDTQTPRQTHIQT